MVHCVLDLPANCPVGVDMPTPLKGWIYFEQWIVTKLSISRYIYFAKVILDVRWSLL